MAVVPQSSTNDSMTVMRGVSWEAFESYLRARRDAWPRVTYLEGTLELMSPTKDHESIKRRFAAAVDAYLDHVGITFDGVGSWLLKNAPKAAGLEPDECWILHDMSKPCPDLAIEVVWTSGGIDKLEVYRRLGVGEVWFWKDDVVTIYVLTAHGYEARRASECLPSFDFGIVSKIIGLPSLSAARKVIREWLETLA